MTAETNARVNTLAEFGQLARPALKKVRTDEAVLFDSSTVPAPPLKLSAQGLGVTKTSTNHDKSFPHERAALFGARGVFADLGLLLASAVLHGSVREVEIELMNAANADALAEQTCGNSTLVHRIVLHTDYLGVPAVGGLLEEPRAFFYVAEARGKHPWWPVLPQDSIDLPVAYISDRDDVGVGPRNTLYGFGSAQGAIRFASLLMDIEFAGHAEKEHALEAEVGFRGVGPGSVELSLHLPDSQVYQQRAPVLGLPEHH